MASRPPGEMHAYRRRVHPAPPTIPAVVMLVVLASAVLPAPEAAAQEIGAPMTAGTLRLRSDPPGALVRLDGEHRWSGTTPWDLNRSLRGIYRVHARLDGYERWSRTIQLAEGESRELQIRLTPKSPWKAGLRSLLIPGWGQRYADRPGKATLFFLSAAVAGGGLLWTHAIYQDRVDDFEAARAAYRAALRESSLEELASFRGAMQRSENRADRAYDDRQAFLYALGGIYALSLVDALFFFPEPSEGGFAMRPFGEAGPLLTLGPGTDGEMRLRLAVDGWGGSSR